MLILDEKQDYKTGGIYKLSVIETPYVYIGSSKAISSRVKTHTLLLKKGEHHNKRLQDYYTKGFEIKVDVIERIGDISILWKRELYHMYENELFLLNETHNTKSRNNNYISKEVVEKIANLYKNGMNGTQISLEIYGTRNRRATINKLIKGDAYPNFKHLFDHREFTQQGKKRGAFTCSPKYRDMEYLDKLKAVEIDKKYIIENMGILSGRQIAKNIELHYTDVHNFIKRYKKENSIVWEERLTEEIKEVYVSRYGWKTVQYDSKHNVVDDRNSMQSFKKDGFYSTGILKSSEKEVLYKNFYFKVEKNEL